MCPRNRISRPYSLQASVDYKEKHDNLAKIIHMELASKYCLFYKKNAVPYFCTFLRNRE